MKIMMKNSPIKEIVKGAPNDTEHQNAHPKKQYYRLWWGAADQCLMSHCTYIHIMI